MAITNVGYDGSISAVEFAQLEQHAGVLAPVVCGKNDFAVSANVGGTLTCNVAAGSAVAPGVLTTSDATASVSFDSVVTTGQTRWDAVVLRRNWSTNTSTLVVVKGTAAAGAVMVLPSGVDLILNSGFDQVLALVQITYGLTVPTSVVDRRLQASKVFTAPSTGALPTASTALYGMEAVVGSARYRCLSDASNNPAWITETTPHLARYRNATLTTVSGTTYTVDFNVVDRLVGGFGYSTGVVTIPVAGVYQINAGVHYQSTATTGSVTLSLTLNGAFIARGAFALTGENNSQGLSRAYPFAAGDTTSLQFLQSSGTSMILYGAAASRYTYLDITYLGA